MNRFKWNFLLMVLGSAEFESGDRITKFEISNPIWRTKNVKVNRFEWNLVLWGFGILWFQIRRPDSIIRNVGSNMADQKCKSEPFWMEFSTLRFWDSLISNLKAGFHNSKWQIQYGGPKMKKSNRFEWNLVLWSFGTLWFQIWKPNSIVWNFGYNMADQKRKSEPF